MHIREHMHIGALRAHPLCSADPCRVSSTIPPPRSPSPPPLVVVAVPLPPTVSRPSVRFSPIASARTTSAILPSTSSLGTKTEGPLWSAPRTCGTIRRPASSLQTSLAGTAARAIRRSPRVLGARTRPLHRKGGRKRPRQREDKGVFLPTHLFF